VSVEIEAYDYTDESEFNVKSDSAEEELLRRRRWR